MYSKIIHKNNNTKIQKRAPMVGTIIICRKWNLT